MNQHLWYAVPGLCIIVAIAAGFLLHTHEAKAPTLRVSLSRQIDSPTTTNDTHPSNMGSVPIAHDTLHTSTTPQHTATAPNGPSISLSIQGLYTDKQVTITANETLLTLLQTLSTKDPHLQLEVQNYTGLGALITSMGGLTNGTNKNYWQYTVNGVEPQIGASGYILHNGDRVAWQFGPSRQ